MAPTKTRAVVLKVMPYRETSYIVYLFSESHGLVHGLAKGMRRAKKGQNFIERGFLTELLLYARPHRDLHTLGSIQVLEFYPITRTSLLRTAVRDVAFELILAAITLADPHPELFDFFTRFLGSVEGEAESTVYPFVLWCFYLRFAAILGFALGLDTCIRCGRRIGAQETYMNLAKGGVECRECSRARPQSNAVRPDVLGYLRGNAPQGQVRRAATKGELGRITRLLADHCRYHFDVRNESKALGFLEELVGVRAGDGQ